MKDTKATLSTLWIFAVLNYGYADVFTAMDPSTNTEALKKPPTVHMTHGFMLGAAIFMETAIAMVVLSRILQYRANRWANIIAGYSTLRLSWYRFLSEERCRLCTIYFLPV